jgi:RNA polymerase sigma-70 factor (ECF subfamily)
MATADAGLSREADDVTISGIEVMRAGGRYADAHECYGDLVRRHQRRAVRIAYRMLRDQADADEVVQDAFVKAYLHLPSFRRELPFEVWFTRILINRCLDRLRARKRRERWVVSIPKQTPAQRAFWEGAAGSTVSPEDQVLARERCQKLARALTRLPERQRSVIILSHYKGLTSPQVSALTGWNPSTVRVQLFRGLRSLRTLLGVSGSQSTTATPTAAA